jgi:hypothetical protein
VELSSVFAVEAGLSMVRSAVVLAPSGLGVVDLGYATMFLGMGASPASASAFVLLKRGKEAAWVAVGFALLAALRRPAKTTTPETTPAPATALTQVEAL